MMAARRRLALNTAIWETIAATGWRHFGLRAVRWCVRPFNTLAFTQICSGCTAEGRGADDCIAGRRFAAQGGDAREFLLDDGGELRHLLFHLDHFFAHVENDFDAGEIDAHV